MEPTLKGDRSSYQARPLDSGGRFVACNEITEGPSWKVQTVQVPEVRENSARVRTCRC